MTTFEKKGGPFSLEGVIANFERELVIHILQIAAGWTVSPLTLQQLPMVDLLQKSYGTILTVALNTLNLPQEAWLGTDF